MQFIISDHLFIMSLTESTLLDMFGPQRVLNLCNNTVTSTGHKFKVFHYDPTFHVLIAMLALSRFKAI